MLNNLLFKKNVIWDNKETHTVKYGCTLYKNGVGERCCTTITVTIFTCDVCEAVCLSVKYYAVTSKYIIRCESWNSV